MTVEPRECIMEFARDMEKKLRSNDEIKPHWRGHSNARLLKHLMEETGELVAEYSDGPAGVVIGLARYEAVDVALLAMMLWDNTVPGDRDGGR